MLHSFFFCLKRLLLFCSISYFFPSTLTFHPTPFKSFLSPPLPHDLSFSYQNDSFLLLPFLSFRFSRTISPSHRCSSAPYLRSTAFLYSTSNDFNSFPFLSFLLRTPNDLSSYFFVFILSLFCSAFNDQFSYFSPFFPPCYHSSTAVVPKLRMWISRWAISQYVRSHNLSQCAGYDSKLRIEGRETAAGH